MVDNIDTVCCMCGDIGFPDKLFRCSKCRSRVQHSYCSNYYCEASKPIQVCEWCQCDAQSSGKQSGSSRKSMVVASSNDLKRPSELSDERSKHHEHGKESMTERGKNSNGGGPSPRQATRRYKLLKDVMS